MRAILAVALVAILAVVFLLMPKDQSRDLQSKRLALRRRVAPSQGQGPPVSEDSVPARPSIVATKGDPAQPEDNSPGSDNWILAHAYAFSIRDFPASMQPEGLQKIVTPSDLVVRFDNYGYATCQGYYDLASWERDAAYDLLIDRINVLWLRVTFIHDMMATGSCLIFDTQEEATAKGEELNHGEQHWHSVPYGNRYLLVNMEHLDSSTIWQMLSENAEQQSLSFASEGAVYGVVGTAFPELIPNPPSWGWLH